MKIVFNLSRIVIMLIAVVMVFSSYAQDGSETQPTISYSWSSPDGTVIEWGGTIAYVNGNGDRLNYLMAGYYTVSLNGKKANLEDADASANAGHMIITLDEAFKKGDIIRMTGFRNKNMDGKKASVYMLFENGTAYDGVEGGLFWTNICSTEENLDYDNDGDTPSTFTWVVPEKEVGTKTITLTRSDYQTNLFITDIKIESNNGKPSVIESGSCGENLTWTLNSEGVLRIEGTGAMNNFSTVSNPADSGFTYAPWHKYYNIIQKVDISQGITSISEFAFSDCFYVTDVIIPSSVTEIGQGAFSGCSSTANVNIDSENTYFQYVDNCLLKGTELIWGNSQSVLPNSITAIGNYAFSISGDLQSIIIPENVKTIGVGAFERCGSLGFVEMPSTLEEIGDYAFSGIDDVLRQIVIKATTPPTLGTDVFSLETDYARILVPEGYYDTYKKAEGWKDYLAIIFDRKCATPTVKKTEGGLELTCDTEGAVYHYSMIGIDSATDEITTGSIQVGNTLLFNIYASAEGCFDSDPISYEFSLNHFDRGDVNQDGSVSIADVASLVSIITKKPVEEPEEDVISAPERVDLGIKDTNGKTVYWSSCNVGAMNPWDIGDYFAWGKTEPYYEYGYSQENPGDHWKEGYEDGYSYTSYNKNPLSASYGSAGKAILESVDDAATTNWGESWRMPTYNELLSLAEECYWEWTDNYKEKGVSGYIVYRAKSSSDKGKFSYRNPTLANTYSASDDIHIFLPTAGFRSGTKLEKWKTIYWSSSAYVSDGEISLQPGTISIVSDEIVTSNWDRSYGNLVRPVWVE